MNPFGDQYRRCRVLVTGHTGFKGSWLALWLQELGAQVAGLALPPATQPNHWKLLRLDMPSYEQDIRDADAVARVLASTRPEIVFHLAAQPLVRQSYGDPLETWSTNVIGTASVLEACRKTPAVRAVVVVTSDKCYENREWHWGYREGDPLGGHDPYSASKAAAELVAASYRKSFFAGSEAPLLATARAGNVIGGGDWSKDRLIPDLVRAVAGGMPLEIRSPQATRPWQHVLESLSGYLRLGQMLLENRQDMAEAWNFGPEPEGNRSVAEVLNLLADGWPELEWRSATEPQPHEANLLHLDSSKAKARLGWRPVWNLEQALAATADWYRSHYSGESLQSVAQIGRFVSAARAAGAAWSAA